MRCQDFDALLTDCFAQALKRSSDAAARVLSRRVAEIEEIAHGGRLTVEHMFEHVAGRLNPDGMDPDRLEQAIRCAQENLGLIPPSRPAPDLQIPGRGGQTP